MNKILNFGSLNIDYVYDVEHFVRPGETIQSKNLEVHCGGKGLNQSIALAKAGADVYHAGCVGKEDGQFLLDILNNSDVNTDNIKKTEIRSGNAIIQVDKSGQNCILLYGGANQEIDKEYADKVLSNFSNNDILLLQNEINCVDYIMNKAAQRGMTIALNPSPYNEKINLLPLHLVNIFILNEVEAMDITGYNNSDKRALMDSLKNIYPNAKIVLTLGKKGVLYFDGNEEYTHGIYNIPVVDTTGAGDTFTGYYLACISSGMKPQKVLELASKASSIAVSKKGAAASIPSIEEVEKSNIQLV